MAIVYGLIKNYGSYSLTNGGVAAFSYTLQSKKCGELTTIIPLTLFPSGEGTSYAPGTWEGELQYTLSQVGQPDIVINVYSYNKLRSSLIKSVEKILCGCACRNCECDEDYCDTALLTYNKMLAYAQLTNLNLTSPIFTAISTYMRCRISEQTQCLLNNEFILGTTENELLTKDFIALYYLALYHTEVGAAANVADATYIKTLFNWNKISLCIQKLGISLTEVDALIP